MTSLTTPGDVAGLVLLAAAIVAALARAAASRLAASRPAEPARADHWQHPLAQQPLVQRVPAQRVAPRPSAVAIPAQPTWQSRAGHAPRSHDLASTRPDG